MNKEILNEKLTNVFREVFKSPDLILTDALTNNDIDGWNSLSHAMLLDKIEEHFKISFELEEMMLMHTIMDIREKVIEKVLG